MGTNNPELGDPRRVVGVALGCAPEDIAPNVIITPFMPLRAFRRHFDADSIKELSPPFFFDGLTGVRGGKRITVIRTGIGPSRVGDCISILSMTPAKNLLFIGAVGSLSDGHQIGDIFLPSEAADGEGYTRYLRSSFSELVASAARVSCNGGLEGRLEKFLEVEGLNVKRGPVFTIGSITFESNENLETIKDSGFDAIEMELSAFFSAAAHHDLGFAALTYISDLPLRSSLWDEKSDNETKRLKETYRSIPILSMDFFSSSDIGEV
ncbi:MAG: hypothetical protein C0608_11630 [Deltaproteobacteria bacterium]|nr:MAG: hypothetical protein C0608_11630 [Deltaproteobacteria bacterium]